MTLYWVGILYICTFHIFLTKIIFFFTLALVCNYFFKFCYTLKSSWNILQHEIDHSLIFLTSLGRHPLLGLVDHCLWDILLTTSSMYIDSFYLRFVIWISREPVLTQLLFFFTLPLILFFINGVLFFTKVLL